jgi:hypothetical protein
MKKIITFFTTLLITFNLSAQKENYKKVDKNTMEGTKYGIVEISTGKQIIPTLYDDIGEYTNANFIVIKNKKVGLIDLKGKIIIPIKYTFISNFLKDRTFISNGKKMAMANENGKILTTFFIDDVLGYENDIVRIVVNNKIGYINKTGKTIIKPKFKEGNDCKGNFIVVYSSSWKSLGYRYIQKDIFGNVIGNRDIGMSGKFPIVFNKNGTVIYKGKFSERVEITPNGELAITDMYLVDTGGRAINIINGNGNILHSFNERISVSIENHWIKIIKNTGSAFKTGIIDFNGKVALKTNFKKVSNYHFNNGTLAKVTFPNNGFFYIDKNVKCVEFDNQKCPE